MLKTLGWGVRGLARNTRGNVAILFGLAIIPIVLGVGVAVDYGRALLVRERMTSAADTAALAIGSWTGLTEAELKTKAQQYFNANYPGNTLGTVGKLNVSFQGDDILVSVSGSVPTTFMRLANINSVDVGSTAVITKKERNIELALVLDTTGSMGQGGKMSAMQSAAKTMVSDLFAGKTTSDTLKIAVVPFSAAVNVGSDKKDESWIDKNAKSPVAYEDFKSGVKVFDLYTSLKNRSWQGCVRERDGTDYELTDATPDSGTPASLFAPISRPTSPTAILAPTPTATSPTATAVKARARTEPPTYVRDTPENTPMRMRAAARALSSIVRQARSRISPTRRATSPRPSMTWSPTAARSSRPDCCGAGACFRRPRRSRRQSPTTTRNGSRRSCS